MNEKDVAPYRIRDRSDGLVDLLFPRDGSKHACPCHDRLTVRPHPGLEEDIRRHYTAWRARARVATDDRVDAMRELDLNQAKGEVIAD